jgi:hypothetical protein
MRTYYLISIDDSFKEKFVGFLTNLNNINKGAPVKLEAVYAQPKYAAIPKGQSYEGEGQQGSEKNVQ